MRLAIVGGGVARDLDEAQRKRAILAARKPDRDPAQQFGDARGGGVDRDAALRPAEVERLQRRTLADQQRPRAIAFAGLGQRRGKGEPQPHRAPPADFKRRVDQRQRLGDALAAQQHRHALFGREGRKHAVGGDVGEPGGAVDPCRLLGPAAQHGHEEAPVGIAGALVDHAQRVVGAAPREQIGDDQQPPVEPEVGGRHPPRHAQRQVGLARLDRGADRAPRHVAIGGLALGERREQSRRARLVADRIGGARLDEHLLARRPDGLVRRRRGEGHGQEQGSRDRSAYILG